MLNIKYNKINNIIDKVVLKGHTEYDILGKDIVCAAASSIFITTVNSILSFDENAINYNNNLIENIKKDDITNKLLENMITMFKELEGKYKKNIKIVEE